MNNVVKSLKLTRKQKNIVAENVIQHRELLGELEYANIVRKNLFRRNRARDFVPQNVSRTPKQRKLLNIV